MNNMPQINLNLSTNIEVDSNNKVKIKVSSDSGNTLQILDDGLYAEARPGVDGGDGGGYQAGQSANGIIVGTISPFGTLTSDGRVNGACILHRIFTCTHTDGSDINLRSGSNTGDYVLPGDFYRVANGDNYDYYLITNTSGGGDGSGGGTVTESVKLASVPKSAKLNPND